MVLSVQKMAEMLQVKSSRKRVDDTEIMRTSSGNPSSAVNSENASQFRQCDRVVNIPVVQPTASIVSLATERLMPNIKKIPKSIEIIQVVQRQCPPSRRSKRSLRYHRYCSCRGDARCDERQGRANQTHKKT